MNNKTNIKKIYNNPQLDYDIDIDNPKSETKKAKNINIKNIEKLQNNDKYNDINNNRQNKEMKAMDFNDLNIMTDNMINLLLNMKDTFNNKMDNLEDHLKKIEYYMNIQQNILFKNQIDEIKDTIEEKDTKKIDININENNSNLKKQKKYYLFKTTNEEQIDENINSLKKKKAGGNIKVTKEKLGNIYVFYIIVKFNNKTFIDIKKLNNLEYMDIEKKEFKNYEKKEFVKEIKFIGN